MLFERRVGLWLLPALLLVACGGGGPPPVDADPQARRTPTERLSLKTFRADCGDFLEYAAEALTEQFLTRFYCRGFGPCPVFAARPGPEAAPTPAPGADFAAANRPDRVSTTNLQEQGVDEADIIKADADGRLYILSGRSLHVIDAFPPQGLEQAPLASLALAPDDDPSFYASEMFLDEATGTVVVLGGSYAQQRPRSVALIVDVADPAQPQVTQRVEVDGSLLQARRVGDRVHRVSRYDVPLPGWFYGDDADLSALRNGYFDAQDRGDTAAASRLRAQLRSEIGARVVTAGAQALLPRHGQDSPLRCDMIAHPEVSTGLGLAVVDSFDIDGDNHATSAIINNAYLVYASPQNLYLAQSSFGWFFDAAQQEETVVYRLALSADAAPAYRALAKFDGTISSSYQMSEYDGALRVAATEQRAVDGAFEPVSHVSTFDARAQGVMPRLGSVEGLAPGETIQGTRFVGPRGFVVTFRNVDPLFAVDLSNPALPRVASALKIPGFSSYLMPLGDTLLLTIGRAGNDEQLTGGVAVQLFDTTDLSAVRQLAVTSPDAGPSNYSYSVAEYDPHAFSYFADTAAASVPGTLSVPLQTYSQRTGEGFSGFLVLRVDPSSARPLQEIGRVDHRALIDRERFCGPGSGAPCASAVYAAEPRRSVFMQDAAGRYLYTVSLAGLVASNAAQPSTTFGLRALPYDAPCCAHDGPAPGGP